MTELDLRRAERSFEPLAAALRDALLGYYDARGHPMRGMSAFRTLETNSTHVAQRTNVLLALAKEREGSLDLAGSHVLDLGCGFGALAVYLASLGARVTAVDPNAEHMTVGRAVAEGAALPATFVRGRMEDLPLPDGAFDLVLVNNSLCYVRSQDARLESLRQVMRVLSPGGRVLICNPGRSPLRDPFTGVPLLAVLPEPAASAVARALRRQRTRVRLVSPRAQRAELTRAGLAEITIRAPEAGKAGAVLAWLSRYQHIYARRPHA